jgi:hypothetical protein
LDVQDSTQSCGHAVSSLDIHSPSPHVEVAASPAEGGAAATEKLSTDANNVVNRQSKERVFMRCLEVFEIDE